MKRIFGKFGLFFTTHTFTHMDFNSIYYK